MPRKKKGEKKKGQQPPSTIHRISFDPHRSSSKANRAEKSPRLQILVPTPFVYKKRKRRSDPPTPSNKYSVHHGQAVCIIASGRATNVKINILTNIGETSSLRTSPVTSNNSSLHRVIVRLVGLTRYLVSGACSNIICPSLSLYTRRNGPSNCPICSNDRIIKSPVFSLFLSFSGVQREKFFRLSFFDGGEEGCLFSTRVSSVFLKVTRVREE